jgi:ABC-type polysaccharide/polyol phosphate transport system ATPase subunit
MRRFGSTLIQRFRPRSAAGTRAALNGIDLEAGPREVLGLVGTNGAGKTTLLKTIAGLYAPTSGTVEVRGNLVYLAGLGVGMMSTLSVRRNIYLYGTICGIPRARLDELLASILEWAELQDYAETEVSKLSQGMRSRLALAVTRHIDSEIVLMDEAFSAGDERFQKKTEESFTVGARGDRTFLISTHSLKFVRQYCTRALWMHEGKIVESGAPNEIVDRYYAWAKTR